MSDDLSTSAGIVIGLAMLAGIINWRAEHAIVHDVRRIATGGTIRATVNPRGLLGMLVGQARDVAVTGRGFSTDGFPFHIQRGPGLRAYVGTLRLRFSDFTVRGIGVRSFYAEVPRASLDIMRAFFDERIILRTAGEGTAEAVVDSEAVRKFVVRRYPQLRSLTVELHPGEAHVTAEMPLFGIVNHVDAIYRIAVEEGRYVNADRPRIKLNGKDVTPSTSANILKALNPVLDSDKDLGMSGYFYATGAEIGEGTITIRGRAHVPTAERPPKRATYNSQSTIRNPQWDVRSRIYD